MPTIPEFVKHEPEDPKEDAHTKRALWISMIVGTFVSGIAFAYKVAEFLYTIGSEEAKGFADVPVTVYFAVACGWICLLVWYFRTGKFEDMERAKYEMLETEAEYERQGI